MTNVSEKVVTKVAEHARTILDELKKSKTPNDVHFNDLLIATAKVLSQHPDIGTKEFEGAHLFTGYPKDKSYDPRDVTHRLFCELVTSKVVKDKHLDESDSELFVKFLGRIYPLDSNKHLKEERLAALQELESKYGRKKTNKIINNAATHWEELLRQYNEVVEKITSNTTEWDQEQWKLNKEVNREDIIRKIFDSSVNPIKYSRLLGVRTSESIWPRKKGVDETTHFREMLSPK